MLRTKRYRSTALVALGLAGLLTRVAAGESPAPPTTAVWFDELAEAEPLTTEAREDLARHLSEVTLDPAKPVAALPASLAGDREPRMIFLSLGDGVTRARVLRASGLGVSAVIERLRAEVAALAEGGFTATIARVDLVTEVQARRVDPDRPLALDRSLYGLAFDREMELAFLADEVVTHTLIGSDQDLRPRNVAKRPESAALRPRIELLGRSEEIPLFRFATAASFSGGGEPVPLFRGHRRFADLDPEQLLRHAELAGKYLTRAVKPDGRFAYSYLPKTDKTKNKYNALRHCGTVYSMLELYQVTSDRELRAAAERAIGYLRRELLGSCEVAGTRTACVVEDGEVKLGGNGLAMVALAQHAAATGEKQHLELIDDLGRWILLTQAEDGEFRIHKQSHPDGRVSDFVSGYYPGEALLALVRRPQPDPEWLDAAERGARWLIEVRDRGLPLGSLAHDHWLLYALNELHRLRPDPIYLQHTARISDAILARQRRGSPDPPDWLGSYYSPPRSTPTATRSEGLGAAYRMMKAGGRGERAEALLEALDLGVRFQLQTQFLPETVLYLDDPAQALGGFHRSLTNYEIRIDYVQHNISALLLLRRILLERSTVAPQESKAL
ncbi:MAG: hypothetical protein GY719_26510 [bacterium]|nr:hypothetical protein [bacterium]